MLKLPERTEKRQSYKHVNPGSRFRQSTYYLFFNFIFQGGN